MLNQAASQGVFNYHPHCKESNLTHLCFADDLLIFIDGSVALVNGVMLVLKDFERISRLAVSVYKSCFYSSNLSQMEEEQIISKVGLSKGSLPFRYLGLPLTTKKFSLQDCAPLIQKIKGRLNSWTSKTLNLAGRLQLLNSVIAGITNFWSSAFILPKTIINSLSSAFLWKGTTEGNHTAKVSWTQVTKKKGSLGVRNLALWNRACALKLIWLLFFKSGSIWVAWFVKEVLNGNVGHYWFTKEKQSQSWLAKKLIRLRNQIYPWIKIEIGNGKSCNFLLQNWSPFGKVLDYLGIDGPQCTRIHLSSTFSDLWRNGSWNLPPARSDSQLLIYAHLTTISLSQEPDTITWWINDVLKNRKSIGAIYQAIDEPSPHVAWHSTIWFSGGIPKHKTTTWLFALNRNPTRDRLLQWGIQVDLNCLLCHVAQESRNHLFFDCNFSWAIWSSIAARAHYVPTRSWHMQLDSLSSLNVSKRQRKLILLAWKGTIYSLWTERNARHHRNTY